MLRKIRTDAGTARMRPGNRNTWKQQTVLGLARSCLLASAMLCGAGPIGLSMGAEEPVKTGEERDTLLFVRTDPPGATVLLNGKELGTTNGLFRVEPGTGSIVILLEGRKPGKKQIVIRANAVNRLELSLQRQTEAQHAPFVAHLPQGTVELVGVTYYPPTEQSQWWRPDGSPAHLGPFRQVPSNWSTPVENPRVFLLRIQDLPAGASYPALHVQPSTGKWWGSTGVLGAHGETVPDYYLLSAELAEHAVTADLRVDVSMLAWKPPFRGVEFQNIAFHPGQKTKVTVVSSDNGSSSAK